MPSSLPLSQIGVVAIGRNEGERLRICLTSVLGKVASVVYVDSGSTDGSVALAETLGASVVKLDPNVPFTAARARNEGFARLAAILPALEFVQFVDGDCQVVDGWLDTARAALAADAKLAAVCGRRRERHPERSVYNRLIDLEWDTPVGVARSVGGDAMFRADAFRGSGGFDPTVMAGEEPELCLRLRHAGWTLRRLDAEMTLHDAALLRFGQWWRRQVRSGFGCLDVATRFEVGGERLFQKPTRSARVWAVGWPLAVVAAAALGSLAGGWKLGAAAAAVVALAVPAQVMKLALAAVRRGRPAGVAVAHGALTMASKWAFFLGQVRYLRNRAAGNRGRLIEYKAVAAPAAGARS